MIFTERKITVRKGKSSIDEPVILYRGDYEVELRFTIMESKYRFKSGVNLVDSEKASHAQLALLAPDGTNVFTEVGRCEDGTAIFVLSKEMIDELSEVGLYSFQIRLFDYYMESRITIPPIEFGIEVREPIAAEDHTNAVDDAVVGYSIAKTSVLDEPVPPTFNDNGQYNKTDWETGDRISEGKLNKMEEAIGQINKNEINDVAALDKRITSNYNTLDSTKANKNEIFSMANMGQDVKEAMTGGSVAVVGINAITDVNVVPESLQAYNMAFFEKTSSNLLNMHTCTDGYLVNLGNGELSANSAYKASDYILVQPNTTYRSDVSSFRAEYDSNKRFVKSANTNIITTTSNTMYVRITIPIDNATAAFYKDGDIPGTRDEFLMRDDIRINGNNIQPESISIEHVNFVDTITSANLFNVKTITDNAYMQKGRYISHANYVVTDYIPVEEGKTYVRNGADASYCDVYNVNKIVMADYTVATRSITIPEGGAYIRWSIDKMQNNINGIMISETSLPAAYIPYSEKVKLNENIKVDTNNVEGFDDRVNDALDVEEYRSINLFNVETQSIGQFSNHGGITMNGQYNLSDYIPVEPGKTYVCTGNGGFCDVFNANKVWVYFENTNKITIPQNGAYIRWCYSASIGGNNYMICEGALPNTYIPYDHGIVIPELKVQGTNVLGLGAEPYQSDNLFNKDTRTPGVYSNNGKLYEHTGFNLSDYIPVEAGSTYVINTNGTYCDVFDADKNFIYFENTNRIVIPEGGAYLRWCYSAGTDSNIMICKNSLPSTYVPYRTGIIAHDLLLPPENILGEVDMQSLRSYWHGKRWVAIGDSITEWSYADENGVNVNWREVVTQNIGFSSSIRCAYWGHKMGDIHEIMEYAKVTEQDLANADIITVSLGQNDSGTPIGTINDAPSFKQTSFYGDTKGLIQYLLSVNNKCTLAFITPTPSNGREAKMRELSEIIKEVCALYSIPVLDLNRMSNFNSTNYSYFYVDSSVHPNGIGNRRMGRITAKFIDQL